MLVVDLVCLLVPYLLLQSANLSVPSWNSSYLKEHICISSVKSAFPS